ncbi:MAG: AMP-binding protein [Gemmatimonadales bacterium]
MRASSYVSGPSDRPLIGRTIGAELDRVAAATPDALAVVSAHQGIRLSYGELLAEAERAARSLMALGVVKGDRVGIWSGNRVEWLVTQYATAKIGAVLVNVNPAYRRHELEYALAKSGVSILVAARAFRQTDYLEMIRAVHPKLPSLEAVVLLDQGEPDMLGWDDFLAAGAQVMRTAPRARGPQPDFR